MIITSRETRVRILCKGHEKIFLLATRSSAELQDNETGEWAWRPESAVADRVSLVEAELNYLSPSTTHPRTYTYDPPAGVPRTTTVNAPHLIEIIDARPILSKVALDNQGFGLVGTAAPCTISMTTPRSRGSTTRRPSNSSKS